jgi:fructose-1,6-bisphosphatase I
MTSTYPTSSSQYQSPITLTHFILSDQQQHPDATGDFSILLHSIEIAAKYVSSKVRAAGLLNLYGAQGSTNVQGEQQQKLDVLANDAMITSLRRSHKVSLMASEENEEPIVVEDSKGQYVAVFDPLDGSSNIDVNISIGTIFGILRRLSSPGGPVSKADLLQSGRNLVAAGYVLYGSATCLVYSTGSGVNEFTLDPTIGEFVLTRAGIKIKPRHAIYSVNEGNASLWNEATRRYVENLKHPPSGSSRKPYSLRYVGSMVADVHRTLIYGGIFMYPADRSSRSGKLRLLYEANPMAFLIEQAGGLASNGSRPILDIVPRQIHERAPVFLGSRDDVLDLEASYKAHPDAPAPAPPAQQPRPKL